jgi:hypothetical protein
MRALLLAALLMVPGYAYAQGGPCLPYAALADQLSRTYGEAPASAGLTGGADTARRMMVEVWSSPDGATWTLVLRRPDGIACLMASGEHWVAMEQPIVGRGL